MRVRGLWACATAVLMLSMVFYPATGAEAPERSEAPKRPGDSDSPPIPWAGESVTITLHFKGQGFSIRAPLPGNSTEETVTCPGKTYGGRRSGTIIGEWTFLPSGTFQMQGQFQAELWAKSDSGAKNAGFRLNLYEGDSLNKGMFSDRVELSTPHKFKISDSATQTCRAGVQVKIGLVWLSDPNRVVGPSGGGTFIYGSMDHDSLISFTLASAPASVNLTSVEKDKDQFKVNARVNDSLGLDPTTLTYTLLIGTGPAQVLPAHLSAPSVSAGDNGTSVTWFWQYKKSGAKSGTYTFTVSVYYTNDTFFSNSSQVPLSIETAVTPDAFQQITGGGGMMQLLIVAVIVIVASVGAFAAVRHRRKKARLKAHMEQERADRVVAVSEA